MVSPFVQDFGVPQVADVSPIAGALAGIGQERRQKKAQTQAQDLASQALGDDEALVRLMTLDPQLGNAVAGVVQTNDVRAKAQLATETDRAFREAKLLESLTGEDQDAQIQRLARQAIEQGRDPQNYLDLLGMEPEDRALELKQDIIMGSDIKSLLGDGGFTLNEGQTRFDATGKQVATVADSGEEFGVGVREVIVDGKPALAQFSDDGNFRVIDGATPTPKTGEQISVDADGNVTISRGVAQGDLTNSARGQLEKDVVQDSDILSKTRNVLATFRPEFQTISGRFDALTSKAKAKLGQNMSREEVEGLQEFADYKANTAQLQSEVINQLAGAAVSESEAKRINGFLIDPGSGLFDGDDPITAEAKLKRYERNVEFAIARKNWFLRNGLEANDKNWNETSLGQMPQIIKNRHQEIVSDLTAANPDKSGAEIQAMAIQQGKREFGLL